MGTSDMTEPWAQWKECSEAPSHQERFALHRLIHYEHTASVSRDGIERRTEGTGLSINISEGGLCLLIDQTLEVGAMLRLQMWETDETVRAPTVAEVRWIKPLPVGAGGTYLVGMKFHR
ncbi:MAG TPA: PilZ domain-containing protein [Nitrospiraceae bacterium]|nr:PilZ domain-containing protein [Nitrospiraceae bacterium]